MNNGRHQNWTTHPAWATVLAQRERMYAQVADFFREGCGGIIVAAGPMGAGKSTLIGKANHMWQHMTHENHVETRGSAILFRPYRDNRHTDTDHIRTHDQKVLFAQRCADLEGVIRFVEKKDVGLVCIDEGHMFHEGSVDSFAGYVRNHLPQIVWLIVGIDISYRLNTMPSMAKLLAQADLPLKVRGVCVEPGCNQLSTHTRLPAEGAVLEHIVGGLDMYKPCCFAHHTFPPLATTSL